MTRLYTDLNNMTYLSGVFMSAGYLLEHDGKKYLFADARYIQVAQERSKKDIEVVLMTAVKDVKDLIDKLNIKELEVENSLTIGRLKQLETALGVKMNPVDTSNIRKVKTKAEIKAIKEACQIADKAFAELRPMIKPGMTEKEVLAELIRLCVRGGADKMSFDPIIASGPNSALPHARPTDRKIEKNDWIKFDFGVLYNNYCSDMTRMVFVGTPDEEMRKIHDVVLESQIAAVKAAKAGMTPAELDAVARDIITAAGYGDKFGHSLGHGIGIQVHEYPGVSSRVTDYKLEVGCVITIEPGIYLPGLGGVRIEDIIAIEEDGCEILTSTSKDFFNV